VLKNLKVFELKSKLESLESEADGLIQGNFAAWIALTPLEGLTGTPMGLLMDSLSLSGGIAANSMSAATVNLRLFRTRAGAESYGCVRADLEATSLIRAT